jgi:hypothetical protein
MRRRLFKSALLAGMSTPAIVGAAGKDTLPNGGTVDVRQFGAKGDGVTNDAPAINRAIQFLREHQMRVGQFNFVPRLVFPTGVYAVEDSINLTQIRALNAVIAGEGAVILGRCRDKPVIDALGSRWLTIRDLTVVGDADATPKLGLQIGRLIDRLVADNHCLTNVKLVGHYALACLLNNAAETVGFDHLFCWNDRADPESYCLIQDGLSHFGALSAFVSGQRSEPEHDSSFNENEFINCDFRHSGGGIPIWLGDTSRHRFYRCYAAGTGDSAFVIYCGRNSHTMLDVDCHCETDRLKAVFRVAGQSTKVVIHGLSYKDHGIFATQSIFARDSSVKHVALQYVQIEVGHLFDQACRLLDDPAGWALTGQIFCSEPVCWNGAGRFAGMLFLANSAFSVGMQER